MRGSRNTSIQSRSEMPPQTTRVEWSRGVADRRCVPRAFTRLPEPLAVSARGAEQREAANEPGHSARRVPPQHCLSPFVVTAWVVAVDDSNKGAEEQAQQGTTTRRTPTVSSHRFTPRGYAEHDPGAFIRTTARIGIRQTSPSDSRPSRQ